jgi:hypothetical protein
MKRSRFTIVTIGFHTFLGSFPYLHPAPLAYQSKKNLVSNDLDEALWRYVDIEILGAVRSRSVNQTSADCNRHESSIWLTSKQFLRLARKMYQCFLYNDPRRDLVCVPQ